MVANGKPHPEPYRRAAAALGVDPVSCVAIEDSPTGARSAEAAGCVVVAVPNHVPIDPAPGRVLRRTLVGLTPELLGEIIETTPLPPTGAPRHGRQPPAATTAPAAAVASRCGGSASFAAAGARSARWRSCSCSSAPACGGSPSATPPRRYRPGPFNVHAWVPYWTLDDATPALDEQRQRASTRCRRSGTSTYGLDTFEFDRNAGAEAQQQAADFIADARRRGVPIIASLYDSTDPGAMAAILADPATRAQHVDAIANFAADHDFAGHRPRLREVRLRGRPQHLGGDAPNWVAFVEELGARLHADGRDPHRQRAADLRHRPAPRQRLLGLRLRRRSRRYVDAIRIMAYD